MQQTVVDSNQLLSMYGHVQEEVRGQRWLSFLRCHALPSPPPTPRQGLTGLELTKALRLQANGP